MCGIVALYSKKKNITEDQFKVFIELLEKTQTRGSDATGYSYIEDGKIIVSKGPIKASEFCKTIKPRNLKTKIIIGHCRAKTKGDQKNNLNNHPIIYNDLSLIHNGFVHNDDSLFEDKELKLKRNGEVDSEIIPALIDYYFKKKKDMDEAISSAHEKLLGNFACAMISKSEPDKLWLWRTSNPAHIVETGTEFLITSTKDIMGEVKNGSELDLPIYDMMVFNDNKVVKTENHIPIKTYSRSHYVSSNDDWRVGRCGFNGRVISVSHTQESLGFCYYNGFFK